jgi:hypothetical protein
MKFSARLLFPLLLFLALGCSSMYGPPYDASRFQSAATALDGRVGVFTMKRLVYRPAAGILAFPDGGIPRYQIDRNYLGLYDFATGATRILLVENALKQDWLPGSSSFHVVTAYGPKVIIRTSGQIKKSYAFRSETWVYDLERETREPLPIDAELAARGRELKYFYLTDALGTLVVVAHAAGDPAPQREKAEHLLVRDPGGDYLEIGPMIDYYGLRSGELFYWSPEHRLIAVDLATGRRREAARQEALGLSTDPKAGLAQEPSLVVQQGERSALAVERRHDGGWAYEPLPFTVAQVAGEP